jgi:hypothetical protein
MILGDWNQSDQQIFWKFSVLLLRLVDGSFASLHYQAGGDNGWTNFTFTYT